MGGCQASIGIPSLLRSGVRLARTWRSASGSSGGGEQADSSVSRAAESASSRDRPSAVPRPTAEPSRKAASGVVLRSTRWATSRTCGAGGRSPRASSGSSPSASASRSIQASMDLLPPGGRERTVPLRRRGASRVVWQDEPDEPAMRAAVVTVSDGVIRGTREDASGDLAEELLARRRLRGRRRARSSPTSAPRSRRCFATWPTARVRPGRDHRRDGVRAARRDTRGHPRGDRTRGAGAGRADAPGRAARRRRWRRCRAASSGAAASTLIVNLPGSPNGRPRGPRGAPARRAARDRAAWRGDRRAPDRTRRTPTRSPIAAAIVDAAGSRPRRSRSTARRPAASGNAMRIVPGGEVHGTLGCAEFDEAAVATPPRSLAAGQPQTRTYHHEQGDVEVFLEPHARGAALAIVSRHRRRARARGARGAASASTPCWSRAAAERVTDADRRATDVVTSLDDVAIDGETDVVFTDHDAPGVDRDARAALRSPARFVGVMGSRRHVGPLRRGAPGDGVRRRGPDADPLARSGSTSAAGARRRSPSRSPPASWPTRHERDGGWLDR